MNDNKYRTLFFVTLGLVLGIITTLAIITIVENKKESEVNQKIEQKNKNKQKKTKISKEKDIDNSSKNIEDNNSNYEEINSDRNIEQSVKETTSYDDINVTNTDSEVLNYLKEKKNEVSSKISDGTYKEKAKTTFIELIDFLFYGGTIKNHTFNELTNKAKLEAIKITLQIENKIEEYQPGLIDNIGGKYKNIKTKLVDAYTSKIDEFCYGNEDVCLDVKEEYNRLKSSLKNAFSNTKSKISNFYQNNIKNGGN